MEIRGAAVRRARLPLTGLAVVLAVGILSCRGETLPTPRQVASETDPDDVRAIVLLRLYSQALQRSPEARVLCLGVERGEPSTHLLTSLSGRDLPLRRSARCVTRGIELVDAISGAKAVHVFVTGVTVIGPGVASAEGGYQHGPLAGQGMAYRLEFKLGQWEIVDEQPIWIS